MEERTGGFTSVKRKRGKFNMIDLVLILLALLVVFLIVFVLDPFSLSPFGKTEQNVTLEYTVQFDYVEASFTDNVSLGDEVLGASNKASLGRVSAIRNDILFSEVFYNSDTDTVNMKEYPDRYNVLITVTSDALFTEGTGYTVKGTRIAVGGKYSLMFPDFLGSGYCVSMREVG